jgi:hypothetical protein
VFDNLAQRVPAFGQIDRRELTLENRVLQMVAVIPHRLEDSAKPFVIANVVADQERVPHGLLPVIGSDKPSVKTTSHSRRRRRASMLD